MGVMQQCGINVARAIGLLESQEPNPRLRSVCGEVLQCVSLRGQSLSAACAQYPAVFSPQVLLSLQAAEFSGDLGGGLIRAANLLDSQESLERRVRQALQPPLIMIGVCLLVLALVVNFVLPRLLDLFLALHLHPSNLTLAVLSLMHWATGAGLLWVLALVVFVRLYHAPLQEAGMAWLLRSRFTSRLMGQIQALSFCDVVGRLHAQGIPVLRVLELIRSTTTYRYPLRHMELVQSKFVAGVPFSEAVKAVPYFPRIVSDMIRSGEQTGTLSECMEATVRLLDEDTQDWMMRLTRMLEPIVLAGTGVFVAAVMGTVLLPLYQLMEAIA